MDGSGVVANVVGGGFALVLVVYLFYTLIRPEKF
jgi:K+-transporting ATPase KdpF subunit